MTDLLIKRLTTTAIVPAYQTAGAAGLDLHADLQGFDEFILPAGTWQSMRTGIAVQIPEGYEGQVRGRSGAAFRRRVEYYVGTIDSDYRGEVHVLLKPGVDWLVRHGDRIAQLVIAPVASCRVREVAELEPSERGDGGLGSTGR